MKQLAIRGLFLALAATQADAQINAGEQKPEASLPFNVVQVATLNLPWRIAFLPDGRMLITEKVGDMVLVTQQGVKVPVTNVPAALSKGQGGMLGVFLSPHYAKDHSVYLTYSEPGDGGSSPGSCNERAGARPDRRAARLLPASKGSRYLARWREGQCDSFGAQIASPRMAVTCSLQLAIGSA